MFGAATNMDLHNIRYVHGLGTNIDYKYVFIIFGFGFT